jgi:CRP-like cAMP-binding protein
VGEIALVDGGPRTATGTTTSASRLLVLGHREFVSLLDRFPAIESTVLRTLARRVRELDPDAAH